MTRVTLVESRFQMRALALAVPGAALFIGLMAQVALLLPFTPVPLTGQTFGVYFSSLLMGRRDAVAATGLYLLIGSMGMPVFAHGARWLTLGPTLGYLAGMLAASWAIGSLADRKSPTTFIRAWFYCLAGSSFTFSFGLVGLHFFVPKAQVLAQGLLPFIPGELIKMTLAASMATVWTRRLQKQI